MLTLFRCHYAFAIRRLIFFAIIFALLRCCLLLITLRCLYALRYAFLSMMLAFDAALCYARCFRFAIDTLLPLSILRCFFRRLLPLSLMLCFYAFLRLMMR